MQQERTKENRFKGWRRLWLGGRVLALLALLSGMSGASARAAGVAPWANLTSPTSGALYLSPASFSLVCVASDPDGTVARVSFYRGTTLLGTITNSPATQAVTNTWTLTNLTSGSYSFTARAVDNGGLVSTSAPVAVRVNVPPSAQIVYPKADSGLAFGVDFDFVAEVADADGAIAQVRFLVDGQPVAVLTNSPYRVAISNLALGQHVFSVQAVDSDGITTAPAPVTATVEYLPLVSLSAPGPDSVALPLTPFGLEAQASDPDGRVTRVDFYAGTNWLGSAATAPYAVTAGGLNSGTWALTAVATDDVGGATTSAPVTLRVDQLPTVTITSPRSNAVVYAYSSLSVRSTVADKDGAVVLAELLVDGEVVATSSLSPWTLVASIAAGGEHRLSVRVTDNDGGTTESAPVPIQVDQLPTATLTAPSPDTVFLYSGNFVMEAEASDPDGTVARVEFYRGTTLLASATNAPYTLTVSNLPAGSYALSARAVDDAGAKGTSAVVNIRVNYSPTIGLTSPKPGAVYPVGVAFNLQASASDRDGSVTQVEFFRDGASLGVMAAAPYLVGISNLEAGNYLFSARASDNDGAVTESVPIGVTVGNLPSAVLTEPVEGAVIANAGSFAIQAEASSPERDIAKVAFYVNTTLLGTTTNAPYRWEVASLASGTYTLTARVTDAGGITATSAPVRIRVNRLPTAVFAAPASGSTLFVPQPAILRATASDLDGTVVQVEYFDGATSLGIATESPFSLVVTNLEVGTHTFSARATDNDGGSFETAPITVSAVYPPTVRLTQPLEGTVLLPPYAWSLQAEPEATDRSIVKVDFYANTTLLGSVSNAPFQWAVTNLSAGVYALTARVLDSLGGKATSDTVNVRLDRAPTATVSSPRQGAILYAPAALTVQAGVADSDGVVAQVEFLTNGIVAGMLTNAPYTLLLTDLPAGAYSLTVRATDNDGAATLSVPIGVTVDAPPSIRLANPTDGQVLLFGAPVELRAEAGDTDGTVAKVEFYRGTTPLGSLTNSPYTLTLTNLPAGSLTLTARATDDLGGKTTSDPVQVRVNQAPSVNLTAPAKDIVLAAPATVNVAATAADRDGSVARVEVLLDGRSWAVLTTPPYLTVVSNLDLGTHTLQAQAVDSDGATTLSALVGVSVVERPGVVLTSPVDGATYTPPASFALEAAVDITNAVVTRVDFYRGTTLVGTSTNSPYTVPIANLISGVHVFTAKATDSNGQTTSSLESTVTVNQEPTLSIISPKNGSVLPSLSPFTVQASATDTDGRIQQVEFFADGNPLGTVTNSPFSLVVSNLSAQSHVLTAQATDNLNGTATSAPVTVVLGAPPSIALRSPTNGAVLYAPATLALEADTDGTIQKVEFYRGTSRVATLTNSPYVWTVTNLAAGVHVWSAKATDDLGLTATSAEATVTVRQRPSVTITNPAAGEVFGLSTALTLAASASTTNGQIVRVDFYAGTQWLGTATNSPYRLTLTNLAAGAYALTAVATDDGGGTGVSPIVNVKVNAAPTVSIARPSDRTAFWAPATFTIEASAQDPDGTVALVEFLADATFLGAANSSPYTAVLRSMRAGVYSIRARATDNDGTVAESEPITVYVVQPPQVSLVAPANGATVTPPFTLQAQATNTDNTVAKVEFYAGTTLLGTATNAPFALTVADLAPGSYALTAKAIDVLGVWTVSAKVTVTVAGSSRVTLSAPRYRSGLFEFTVGGQAGSAPLVVEASTNLVQWTPLWTNPPSATAWTVTDSNANRFPARFYRVAKP